MRSHCNRCGEGNCDNFEKTDFVIAATGDLSDRRISDPGSSASAVADDSSVNEGIASTCFATNSDRDAAPVIASKRTIEEVNGSDDPPGGHCSKQVRRMESTEKAAMTNSSNQTRPGAKKKDLEVSAKTKADDQLGKQD
ncbi:unnamed protein product [Allacma fusca]|uniref:Uncharacterized protein n=1 Tax=Allacma fusca TaxID=39272 RepID=A0A8J2JMQ6_9HEXA|nr:unnamed protein product [Allacma fusca]